MRLIPFLATAALAGFVALGADTSTWRPPATSAASTDGFVDVLLTSDGRANLLAIDTDCRKHRCLL